MVMKIHEFIVTRIQELIMIIRWRFTVDLELCTLKQKKFECLCILGIKGLVYVPKGVSAK